MSDRARQFMPFSALNGFHKLIKEKERIVTAKKELSEDEMQVLSDKIMQVKKGMVLKVTYFHEGEYIVAEGVVTQLDFIFRRLTIVKTKINFDDIIDISLSECIDI